MTWELNVGQSVKFQNATRVATLMFEDMTHDQNSSKAQAEIDANLRRAYDEVTQQEVPDRFKELIERLRASETAEEAASTDGQALDEGSDD